MTINDFYLASPFFTSEQSALVKMLEVLLRNAGYCVFSPREHGPTLKDLTPAERQVASADVFNKNKQGICDSEIILAVIDGRDPGVMFELGYGHALGKLIITYTNQDFGLNVMVANCATAHVRGMAQLQELLRTYDFDKFKPMVPAT
jgi:nucleoside 2-deoxyribosyltransferase